MDTTVFLSALFLTVFSSICNATIFQKLADIPVGEIYDFIVIGGGVGGSVTANRLTEIPHFKVLVIEAGPTDEDALNIQVPLLATRLEHTVYDWNFTTTPQAGLKGRTLDYPRGHVLGGSSSINGMFYTRGSSSDFDRWAAVTGDSGWSWDRILPYILKNEKVTAPADHHSTIGEFDPAVHNFNGITSVSLPGFPRSIDGRVIQTTDDLKQEFPFNLDMNSGTPLGLGWLQATIGNGTRSSAATAYLARKFTSRSNLDIVLNTRVIRVLQTGNPRNKTFRTVEAAADGPISGLTRNMTASKEVILSAGSIGTPHILLNSGIGDQDELRAVGVPPVIHLPSVGKNLTDQPQVALSWFANATDTDDNIFNNATLLAELLDQWMNTRTGPLVDAHTSQIAWLRIPDNSSIFVKFPDPSAGPNSPHYELVMSNGAGFASSLGPGSFVGAGLAVVTPVSRGTIKLNTSDPFDQPLIDVGFLTSDFDVLAMREAVASTRRFFAGPSWRDYVLQPAGEFANVTTDALLDEFIRSNARSPSHPIGTAAMSAINASYGVVNPDLLVKGIEGLRIVDASVMPFITCGHTQAPTYAIAERAADIIKAIWKS